MWLGLVWVGSGCSYCAYFLDKFLGLLGRDISDQRAVGWGIPLVEVERGGWGGDRWVGCLSEQFSNEVPGLQYIFPAFDFPSIGSIG